VNLARELQQSPYLHRFTANDNEVNKLYQEQIRQKADVATGTRHENLAFHVQVVIETGCRGDSCGKPEAPDRFKKKYCAHYESSQQN